MMKLTQKRLRDSLRMSCTTAELCEKFEFETEKDLLGAIQLIYPNERGRRDILSMLHQNNKRAAKKRQTRGSVHTTPEVSEAPVMPAVSVEESTVEPVAPVVEPTVSVTAPAVPAPAEELEILRQRESELSSTLADCEASYYEYRRCHAGCKNKMSQVLEKLNAMQAELDEQKSLFAELKAEANSFADKANACSANRSALMEEIAQVRAEISELTMVTVIASDDTIVSEVELNYSGYEELYKNILMQLDPDEFSGVSISQVRVVAQLICATRNSIDREVYVEFDNPEATQLFEKFK